MYGTKISWDHLGSWRLVVSDLPSTLKGEATNRPKMKIEYTEKKHSCYF